MDLAEIVDYECTPEEELRDRTRFTSPRYIGEYPNRLKRLIDLSRVAGIEPVFLTQPLLVARFVTTSPGRDLVRGRSLRNVIVSGTM